MTIRPNELLRSAKAGTLTPHELDQVVAALQETDGAVDRYALLHIVGRAGDRRYEGVVAGFLDHPSDPMLSRLALQILCDYWGRTAQYLVYVRRFVEGVDWDTEDDVRQMAIAIAGDYLAEHKDADLLGSLMNIATQAAEREMRREFALRALAVAVRVPSDSIPDPRRRLNPTTRWADGVLRQASEELEQL